MRIKIDNAPTVTKTYKYMFGIELSLYNMTNVEKAFERLEPYYINELWDKINVYLDDKATTDYNLEEQLSSDQPTYIYHIKVDTRVPEFASTLDIIKTSSNYVDCYQCKDADCHNAIIRLKVNVPRRIKHLLNSKYSMMYKKEELESIKKNHYIINRYSKLDKNNEYKFNEPILVLTRDEEALNTICDKLGITDEKTISIMKENEYDSKFNLNNEIINSKELC